MAKNLHNDNLEDFFRNTLNESSDASAQNDWDVPSDQVWEKIDQSINTEDDSGGIIWWPYLKLGGLLLFFVTLFLTSYFVLNQEGEAEYQNEIATESPDMKDNENSIEQNQISPILNKNVPSSESTNNTNPLDATAKEVDSNSTGKAIDNSPTKKADSSSKPTKVNPQNIQQEQKVLNPSKVLQKSNDRLMEKDSGKKVNTQEDIAQGSKTQKIAPSNTSSQGRAFSKQDSSANASSLVLTNQIQQLLPIPTKSALVDWSPSSDLDTLAFLEEPFTDLDKKINLSNKKFKQFYIGVSVAPAYNNRKVVSKRNPVLAELINRNEKTQFSLNAGLQIGYQFSKNWSIESGFIYSKQSTKYRARRQVRYSMLNERMNAMGEFERDYSLDIETSSGDVSTDIALARTASTSIEENDFINLRVISKQQVSYGSIPLILRYQTTKGKLNFGVKAGLLHNFLLEGNSKIESIIVPRSGLRPVNNNNFQKTRKLNNLNSYHLHYLIGAGLNYSVSRRCWIYLEPTFSSSLTPAFKNRNFKTLPSVISLQLGVNFAF